MIRESGFSDLQKRLSMAVAHYWLTRQQQAHKQNQIGRSDQGARSAVTGGAQMDGFIQLLTYYISKAGVEERCIFHRKALELPGFFRPTKQWDLLVVRDGQLLLALEAKSQVGPSFGNNFNNRTEEAMGSALDLWTAFREGAFNLGIQPFLGYFFMLEDCPASQHPVHVQEPHFKVFPEFIEASYAKRYELFCRRLVRERHYTASAFLLSNATHGIKGVYQEPASDLTVDAFVRTLVAYVTAHVS
jgi:hypothetical protein